MDDVTKFALAKLVKEEDEKTLRAKVGPGVYKVDVTLHISGTLKVGKDYPKTPTVSIPVKEVMALLIHRMGVTREKAKEILIDVLKTAIAESGKGEGSIAHEYKEEIEAAEAHVKEVISALPKTISKGQVRPDLLVTEVIDFKTKVA
jgi:hypothetical protein